LAKFVPNVLTADALGKLNIPTEKFAADHPKMVKAGLDRLYALQREDGGWGWFDKDTSDPFMTACAVAGLSEAKRLGYAVDAVRLEEGVKRARKMALAEPDRNIRAWLCLALSRGEASPAIDMLVENAGKLSPYALAAGALALQRWGRPEAADFRARLASVAGNGSWRTFDWKHRWENMEVETTALAVLALTEAEPFHPAIAPAVEWLLAQRTGNRWRSTKDTATAIHAILSHVVATGGKLDALARAVDSKSRGAVNAPTLLKHAKLSVNGSSRDVLIDLNNPGSTRFECHYSAGELKRGENRVEIASEDGFEFDIEGTLRTTGGAPPADPKRFTITTTTDKPLDALRAGDEVVVTVTLTGQAEYDYVMAEVPIPAGCEVIPGSGDGEFSRFEARYEQANFFLLKVAPEATATLRFRMRCLFAGAYTCLAPSAAVMYDESLSGSGASTQVRIGP
jgi:uncharacterized protein YfaS (alpha-2-macroglobulin family)